MLNALIFKVKSQISSINGVWWYNVQYWSDVHTVCITYSCRSFLAIILESLNQTSHIVHYFVAFPRVVTMSRKWIEKQKHFPSLRLPEFGYQRHV